MTILYAGLAVFSVVAAFTECPLNCRVGENSPSLCPTMFSVTYTGMNFLPLCTPIVCPTNSGRIVERRDQVRTTFFSLVAFNTSIFFSRWPSVNGPFFTERPINLPVDSSRQGLPDGSSLFHLPADDPFVRALVVARFEPARGLPPRRHRMPPARSLAFAAAMWMVDRVHGHAAVVRHLAHPTFAPGFAQRHVFVFHVADLADGGHAIVLHAPH